MENLVTTFLTTGTISRNMYETQHHNRFHLEGDVLTHTLMVYSHLPHAASKELCIAALYHDCGKIDTVADTYDLSGFRTKRTFYGHAGYSAFKFLDYAREYNLSGAQTAYIFSLISAHMDAHQMSHQKFSDVYSAEDYLHELIDLSNADNKGRICNDDQQDYLGGITPTERKQTVRNKTVTFLIGPPCSGKTSYIKRHNIDQSQVLSRDAIIESLDGLDYNDKYENANQELVNDALVERALDLLDVDHVYVDMTNCTRKGRRRWKQIFRDREYRAVVFCVGVNELFERNKKRIGKKLSPNVITKFITSFQIPTYSEMDKISYQFPDFLLE